MKKLLCYLGIFVLLGLALLPPILRIVLPKEEKTNKKEIIISKLLSCQNEEVIVKEKYENNKVKTIVIKKLLIDEENIKSNELVKIFDSIKDNGNINYNKLEDGEVISIDFSVDEHKDLKITSLTKDIESQELFFENQGLICTIQ